jgi:hypothetical protein
MVDYDLAGEIHASVRRLRAHGRRLTVADLQTAVCDDLDFLEVSRLLLRKRENEFLEDISREAGEAVMTWRRLQCFAVHHAQRVAEALAVMGLLDAIEQHGEREWSLEDVLIERYRAMMAPESWVEGGLPILADFVAQEFRENDLPYEGDVMFVGRAGNTARCDFAVPSRSQPKIVIEAKEFDKIGYRFGEYLGEVLTIAEAKYKYFFLVTDGLGWHTRPSDLQKLVDYQNEGLIDMIYTLSRLSQLAADVKHICETE